MLAGNIDKGALVLDEEMLVLARVRIEIAARRIDHDLAMQVIRFARERDVHVQAYSKDDLLVEKDRPEAHEYADHAGMPIHVVGDLDEAMGPTTPKLVMVAKREVLEALLPEVRQHWQGKLNAATSMPIKAAGNMPKNDKAE